MAWATIFANLASGNQPLSLFDDMFAQVATLVAIPATASGTNAITLSGLSNAPTLAAYQRYVPFRFRPAGASSGPVTIQYQTLPALNAYKGDGITQVGTGDLVTGNEYVAVYDASLNGGAGGFYVEAAALSTASIPQSVPAPFNNQITNPTFNLWQRGSASISCPAGSRTFLADRHYVNPAGAAVTQQRSTTVPPGSHARFSHQITGAGSVTTVLFGQRIEAARMPDLRTGVIWSAKVFNNTGASFAPTLLLGTPNAADDFTTVVNRLTQTLDTCIAGGWTTLQLAVDISGYTNIANGLQVELRYPSGSLDAGGKTVNFTEHSLIAGTSALPFASKPIAEDIEECQRFYQKSYNLETAPGLASNVGPAFGWSNSGGVIMITCVMRTRMRATPTGQVYSPITGAAARINDNLGDVVATIGFAGESGFIATGTGNASATCDAHWTADAEL